MNMDRSKSQFSRLVELDRQIRAGKYPNCLTFGAEWETSQKTIQRDIDFLRDQMGAPIEYDKKHKGYCYNNRNWFLPALSLSEGDLLGMLVASRALEQYQGTPVAKELKAVFARISELMPEKISIRPELAFTRFTFTAPPSKPVDERIWVTIVRGLQDQRRVRIKYQSVDSPQPKDRSLSPYHIANLQGEWYVFGPTSDHEEVRQYSMARISSAKLEETPFEVAKGFDAKKLLGHTFGRFVMDANPQTVRVLFDKEIAPWVLEREWHHTQKVKTRRDGGVELSLEVGGLYEVQRWVLAWGRHAQVLEPLELAARVKEEVLAMAGRYGGERRGR
jgi:predicted DNA-binding transcriptional regulator YafY